MAHSDVIKAEIQANDAQRQLQDTKLAEQNARLAQPVLLFPNFFQDFELVNDLSTPPALPARSEVEQSAKNNNPSCTLPWPPCWWPTKKSQWLELGTCRH